MADAESPVSKLSSGRTATGEDDAAGVTFVREECLALLELIEAAREALSAMEPCFAQDLHRKWWQVLPELELAHARLAKAMEVVGFPGYRSE